MSRRADGTGQRRHLRTDQVADVDGAVVVIDVIRAFSTAAYAFSAGAVAIHLACATATARAVAASGLGAPAYVITGWFADRDDRPGLDDRLTADFIDAIRRGERPDADAVAKSVATTDEATRTLALGAGHVDPRDIAFATDVDRFDFAMEVTRDEHGLRLECTWP